MDAALRTLFSKQGFQDKTVSSLETMPDAPLTVPDLASGAASEDDARTWAQELGLQTRPSTNRFVIAWAEANRELSCSVRTQGENQQPSEQPGSASAAASSCFANELIIKEQAGGLVRTEEGTQQQNPQLSEAYVAASSCPSEDSSVHEQAELTTSQVTGLATERKAAKPTRLTPIKSAPVLRTGMVMSAQTLIGASFPSRSTTDAVRGEIGCEVAKSLLTTEVKDAGRMVAACSLFVNMPKRAIESIQAKISFQAPMRIDERVFNVGDQADEMFLVVSGAVEIRSATGSSLAMIGAGGFFGEIGVLFAGVRSADAVVCQGPCELAKLRRSDLQAVGRSCGFLDQLFSRGQALPHVRSWFVSRLPLFAQCAEEGGFVSAVAEVLQVQTSCAGEVIVKEGDDGDSMFFIFEGAVGISKSQQSLRPIKIISPSFFGELAMLYSEPRSATVTCDTACRFYVLKRDALHKIMQEYPSVIGRVYSTAQEASSLKLHFIKKIPLFKSMTTNEEFLANMQLALASASFAPGEFLLREGDNSDGRMFAIAHGHAEIRKTKQVGHPAQRVGTLSAGAIFGEVALLLDTPRVASIVAVGHCHVYTLSRDAFETLAVVYKAWWREMMSERGVLREQLKNTGVKISSVSKTRTHGLQLPDVDGVTVSSILMATQAPVDMSAIPQEKLCVVCRCNEKRMLSMPCGHITMCQDCYTGVKNCPICRIEIQECVKAIF